MSMFDSAFAVLACPACGVEAEREVQFKAEIGRTYSPTMQKVRIGQRMEHGWPPIPILDLSGYVVFGCCPARADQEEPWATVRIERGVLTAVVYPVPEDYDERHRHLPESRLAARRQAAADESYRRRWRAQVEKSGRDPERLTGLQRIASHLVMPLLVPTDYAALGRRLFRTGQVHGNYWRPGQDQPWQRREECPL